MASKHDTVCRCEAYKFPHREGGGDCEMQDGEYVGKGSAYRFPFIDDAYLDDPRRGQAKSINAENKGGR
jgi:hypothetical protein